MPFIETVIAGTAAMTGSAKGDPVTGFRSIRNQAVIIADQSGNVAQNGFRCRLSGEGV
jgi:hypothetical protein